MDPAAVADELQSQLDALVAATGVPGATMAVSYTHLTLPTSDLV